MKRRRQHPEQVAEVTRRLLRSAGAPNQAPPEADPALIRAFAQAAGRTIALHARPRGLRDGVLVVAVDSSVWLQEISFWRRQLTQKVAAALGREVRDVKLVLERFTADPTPAKAVPREEETLPQPALSPSERALVEAATAPLAASDPELGQAAARALGGWRAKRRREDGAE